MTLRTVKQIWLCSSGIKRVSLPTNDGCFQDGVSPVRKGHSKAFLWQLLLISLSLSQKRGTGQMADLLHHSRSPIQDKALLSQRERIEGGWQTSSFLPQGDMLVKLILSALSRCPLPVTPKTALKKDSCSLFSLERRPQELPAFPVPSAGCAGCVHKASPLPAGWAASQVSEEATSPPAL